MEQIVLIPPFRVDSVDRDRSLDQVICLDRIQIHVEKDCIMFKEGKTNVLLDIFNAVKCQLNNDRPLNLSDLHWVGHTGGAP